MKARTEKQVWDGNLEGDFKEDIYVYAFSVAITGVKPLSCQRANVKACQSEEGRGRKGRGEEGCF